MANAKNTQAPAADTAALVRLAEVGALIGKAGKAAASMLALCKEAAQKAAAQLDPAKPIGDRIADVVNAYKTDFATAGHNVKALFVDALTLHAAAQCPVTVSVVGKDGKRVDETTTAGAAVGMAKHAMRDAAKQVRDAHGIGRKAGGGRKGGTTSATPTQDARDAATATAEDAFVAWLDNLPEYLNDAVYHPRIVARLIEEGYTLGKAATGTRVRGKASAK